MLRATTVRRSSRLDAGARSPSGATAVLQHDERLLRRKAISLADGSRVLVDLPEPVVLAAGDELVLEDGGIVVVEAAVEELYEITARDAAHLTELAWHIGNRHLPAAVSAECIRILRDHVIKAMLEGLGATVRDVAMPFDPVRGAYSGHGHGHHDHDHHHHHGRDPHHGD